MNNPKENFEFYLANQDDLVSRYNGRYLVIKDKQVVGDYSSEREAYFESVEKYGLGNFIIQFCSKGDAAYTQNFSSRVIFQNI